MPRQAVRDGIAYITEDRKVDGFFETMTVDQNIYLGFLSSPRVKRFLYSTREMKRDADEWIASLSISALKRTLKIVEYSGGNQQKVVVGKSLAQEPTVVIFDEPTRGVDVSAIPQIHAAIRRLAQREQGGRRHLLLSAGNPGDLRSYPGCARRPHRRRNGSSGRDRGARSCTRRSIDCMSPT